jgi:hypothetical protein
MDSNNISTATSYSKFDPKDLDIFNTYSSSTFTDRYSTTQECVQREKQSSSTVFSTQSSEMLKQPLFGFKSSSGCEASHSSQSKFETSTEKYEFQQKYSSVSTLTTEQEDRKIIDQLRSDLKQLTEQNIKLQQQLAAPKSKLSDSNKRYYNLMDQICISHGKLKEAQSNLNKSEKQLSETHSVLIQKQQCEKQLRETITYLHSQVDQQNSELSELHSKNNQLAETIKDNQEILLENRSRISELISQKCDLLEEITDLLRSKLHPEVKDQSRSQINIDQQYDQQHNSSDNFIHRGYDSPHKTENYEPYQMLNENSELMMKSIKKLQEDQKSLSSFVHDNLNANLCTQSFHHIPHKTEKFVEKLQEQHNEPYQKLNQNIELMMKTIKEFQEDQTSLRSFVRDNLNQNLYSQSYDHVPHNIINDQSDGVYHEKHVDLDSHPSFSNYDSSKDHSDIHSAQLRASEQNQANSNVQSDNVLHKLATSIDNLNQRNHDFKKFYGDKRQDVDQWISQCKDISELSNMSPKVMFIKAKLSLQGQARIAWDAITGIVPDTFQKICVFLKNTFGFENPRRHWLNIIQKTHKRDNQSMKEYNRYFQSLVNKLKTSSPSLYCEDDIIELYKSSLPLSHQPDMELKEINSLKQAYQYAIRVSKKVDIIQSRNVSDFSDNSYHMRKHQNQLLYKKNDHSENEFHHSNSYQKHNSFKHNNGQNGVYKYHRNNRKHIQWGNRKQQFQNRINTIFQIQNERNSF